MTATTDLELNLPALLALPLEQRAGLTLEPGHQLRLDERCFFRGALLMSHDYPSFAAALAHVDDLYAMTPRAFTEDHGPILLVLSEVTR
jgi:hypothetical protein